jgi:DNA-directed RNA polymerase specialized sigma subunit
MEKGTIFEARGNKYKLQKITKKGVYASKVVDGDKCRRGRPTKLTFEEVAASLGVTVAELVEKLNKPEVKKLPRPIELVQKEKDEKSLQDLVKEPIKELSKEEKEALEKEKLERQKKVAKLFKLIDDDSTIDDW